MSNDYKGFVEWSRQFQTIPLSGGPDTSIPVPGEILQLATEIPALGHALNLWRNGVVNWEQALMIAVKALAEENQRWSEVERERFLKVAQPGIIEVKE